MTWLAIALDLGELGCWQLHALEMFRHFDSAGRIDALTADEIGAIASQYGVNFV